MDSKPSEFFLGLIQVHPDSLQPNAHIPPIVITSLSRFTASGDSTVITEEKGMAYREALHLSHQDFMITVRFSALDFQNPASNQYAYKLEGLNKDWIPLGTQREVSFSNLPAGRYTLRIIGSNNHNVWNEEGTTLKIKVTPPWWWAWWAKSLYALVFAAGLYLLYH